MSAVTLTVARRERAEAEGTPRGLFVRFPFGAPLGPPHDEATHRAVLQEMLHLLETATVPNVIVDSALRWRQSPGE